ncbi:MAG: hypothetical protein ABI037_00400 [Gemmatimonadales bacterium]
MANDFDVAFPTLSDRDLQALAARGHPREVHAGDLLFEVAGPRYKERMMSFIDR